MIYKRLACVLMTIVMILSFEYNIFATEITSEDCCGVEHEHEHSHIEIVEEVNTIATEVNGNRGLNVTNITTEPIDDIKEDDNIIFINPIGEEYAITRSLASNGFYYYINPCDGVILMDSPGSDEILQIYSGEFSDASYNTDTVYIALENQIIAVNISGGTNVVYSGENSINNISAYAEIIYFTEGEMLCSILPDGSGYTQICEIGYITELVGISTKKIMWRTALLNNEILSRKEFLGNRSNGDIINYYFMYDSVIGQVIEIADYDFYSTYIGYVPGRDNNTSDVNTNSAYSSQEYLINGVSLPLENYPGTGGTFFNRNVAPGTDPDDPENPGLTACVPSHSGGDSGNQCRTYYYNDTSYGMQCWGFANYIYFKLFGVHFSGSTTKRYPDGLTVATQVSNIPLGAHIRINGENHSVILLGSDANGFIVYEANGSGTCQVRINKYLYTSGTSIDWYHYPSEHIEHTFEVDEMNNISRILICTDCGYIKTELHVFEPAEYSDVQHYQICSKCGYTVTENHQFEYSYVDDTFHNATCTVCGDSVSFAHTTDYTDKIVSTHTKYCLLCGHQWSAETHNFYNSGLANTCKQCTDCGYATTAHNMVMTVDGAYHKEVCSVCSYQTTPVTHSIYISSIGETQHQQYCTYCSYMGTKSNHSFSYVKVDSSYHQQVCSVCNYKKAKTSHSMSYISVNGTYHKQKCGLCSHETGTSVHSTQYISQGSSGHVVDCTLCEYASSTVSHSTYYSKSSSGHQSVCSYCSYASGVVSHSYSNYSEYHAVGTAGLCRYRTATCSVCGYVGTFNSYAHNLYNYSWTSTSKPGYTKQRTVTCLRCGYTYIEYQ